MIKKIRIIKDSIYIFSHIEKDYIMFSMYNTDKDYLYFKHTKKNVKALMFGINLFKSVKELLKQQEIDCIECHLGSQIFGGVSLDGKDIVELKMTIQECNLILNSLKKTLDSKHSLIELI